MAYLQPHITLKPNSSLPLVSVICLCYQHEKFVAEALQSVYRQTYPNVELIVVDDASSDGSVSAIQSFLSENDTRYPIKTCFLPQNLGNCAAFNRGLALATGKYVIDFATDDIMTRDRIAQQVAFFETLDSTYGVIFSEARYIDEQGTPGLYHHRDQLRHIRPVPSGDLYAQLLSTYFIASPTMMMRKSVLDELGGYDEQLAYEDFDFWIRSSRRYRYAYQDVCTTQIRQHATSMSTGWYQPGDPQLHSTYLVCRKAQQFNRTEAERQALVTRVRYELRQALISSYPEETGLLLNLLEDVEGIDGLYRILRFIIRQRVAYRGLRSVLPLIRYAL